eukprot:scaffold3677_cov94-Skeletonema_dohrnii-CCMP3373.AAC.6
MSSTTKHLVCQLKEDLLKEQHNNIQSPGHDSDERILDMLNRLDDLNIDIDILTETKIGKTVASFRKKYSQVITIKARALVRKWKRVFEASTTTQQNNVAEVKVESSNSNDIEGSYKKSDDNDDGNIRDTSNENNEIDSTPNEQQSTQAGNKETKMVCDICSKPANFREDIGQLQKCKDCGIYVHELCYCLVPTTELDPNFTCHACKAVQTTVEVNVPSKIGGTGEDMGKKRDLMTVEERPMECILCLHSAGYHAMHPLYDTCGKEGRQYVLKATKSGIGGKPRRLAWVHTLCAQMLIQTKGYLYGVDKDGDFYGSTNINDEDEDADNGEAENDSSSDDSDEEVGGQKYKVGTTIYKEFPDEQTGYLRFFKGEVKRFDTKRKFYKIVYEDGDKEEMTESQVKKYLQNPTNATTKKAPEPVAVATRNFCINEEMSEEIKEARKLKCVICRKVDNHLRIPMQCNVGDEGVHAELKQLYTHVTDVCTKAMHVGCARWTAPAQYAPVAGNKRLRMTYFYPGQFSGDNKTDERYPDPVCGCFCRDHATIIQEKRHKENSG